MSENNAGAPELVAKKIIELKGEQERIEKTARTNNELLARRVAEIRERILHGAATSGDHITDFFIAAYGIIDDAEVSKPFRDLEQQMAGKRKQLFLVVRREKEEPGPIFKGGSSFIGRLPRYHIKSRYFLGIFTDDKLMLDLKEKSYGLPTEAYVEVAIHNPSEKKPGPFRFVGTELVTFPARPEDLTGVLWNGSESMRALEVIVGCNAVLTYSPPELHAESGTRPAQWVVALNAAIRLLGGKIAEAPEEKAAHEEAQKKVLDFLDEKRHAYKRILNGNPSVQTSMQKKCEEDLRKLLATAKELGLEKHALVRLVTEELGSSPR